MLNIFYGDMKEAVYNTASYFKYDYEEGWIVDPMVKEMIQDVDKSVVIDSGIIDSPVLGKIPPIGLSGGVKTLILVKFEPEKVFNVSTCGDNCAKWLLKIAEQEDRTVNLRHQLPLRDRNGITTELFGHVVLQNEGTGRVDGSHIALVAKDRRSVLQFTPVENAVGRTAAATKFCDP